MDANTKDILEAVNFIKDNMATKDDLADVESGLSKRINDLEKNLNDRIDGVESKISGFNNRIDQEVDRRKILEVKVLHLEEKVGV